MTHPSYPTPTRTADNAALLDAWANDGALLIQTCTDCGADGGTYSCTDCSTDGCTHDRTWRDSCTDCGADSGTYSCTDCSADCGTHQRSHLEDQLH